MLWFLKKLVAGGVRKGKLGRDVFCGKSKTLCLTNTGDRFITAAYKACQPSPPKLERQGLNPTQIPTDSSWLSFFLHQKCWGIKKMFCTIFWVILLICTGIYGVMEGRLGFYPGKIPSGAIKHFYGIMMLARGRENDKSDTLRWLYSFWLADKKSDSGNSSWSLLVTVNATWKVATNAYYA